MIPATDFKVFGRPILSEKEASFLFKDKTPQAIGFLTGNPYRDRLRLHAHLPSMAEMLDLWHGQKLIICGGGASIAKTIPQIRRHWMASQKGKPVQLVAVNKTHDWLVKRGIIPTFAALCDPREHVVSYITPRKDVIYLLSTGCHPAVFKKFHEAGAAFAVWVAVNEEKDREEISRDYPPSKGYSHAFVTGGSTVGTRMVPLGTVLGFHDFELHGFDSCAAPMPWAAKANFDATGKIKATMYAYRKDESMAGLVDHTITAPDGSAFRCFNNVNMQQQAKYDVPEMMQKSAEFVFNGSVVPQNIEFAGDGLVPWLAYKAGCHVDMDRMDRVYRGVELFDYRWQQQGKRNG